MLLVLNLGEIDRKYTIYQITRTWLLVVSFHLILMGRRFSRVKKKEYYVSDYSFRFCEEGVLKGWLELNIETDNK